MWPLPPSDKDGFFMHTIKKLKRTIVFILKLALFASLFGIFFGIFGINNPWLFNLSRTTGVTMVTFVVLGIALMQVYGGYAIVTGKYNLNAQFMQMAHRLYIHSIAFPLPVREIKNNVGPKIFKSFIKYCCAHNAVNVVISIDGYFKPIRYSLFYYVNGFFRIFKQLKIIKSIPWR